MLPGKDNEWDLFLDDIYFDLSTGKFSLKLTPKVLSVKKCSCEEIEFIQKAFGIKSYAIAFERK